MAVIKSARDRLEVCKNNIEDYHTWFSPNFKRFNKFARFVCQSSLSKGEKDSLAARNMPQLEFNFLEAMISRLRAEFSQQEPTLNIVPIANATKIDPQTITLTENYIRSIISDSNKDNFEYDVFTDQLIGGFSTVKIYTDYASSKSFHQNIMIRRAYDPTMCIFDKLSQTSHKGDGRFCAEMYPKTSDEIKRLYGSDAVKNLTFKKNMDSFSWSYKDIKGQEIALLSDYYDKKVKKKKIVQLLTGETLLEDEYEKYVEWWNSMSFIQVPSVVNSRMAEIETICRYVLCETEVLDYEETDYRYLPLVFIDGNSRMIRDNDTGSCEQITRPYVYHAEGVQRLTNYAGNSLANELENMIQSKLMAPKEGIPLEYKDGYINWQQATTLIYNSYKEDDPNVPLPPPTAIPRVPAPPEIMQAFSMGDQMSRAILGNYDAALNSPNNSQLSGEAIVMGTMQSNAASKPYLVSYIKGWNRIGEIILDLVPKYITDERMIPQKGLNNKRSYAQVNGMGQPILDYNSEDLEIRIEAGVNFEMQRTRSFEMLNRLMQTSPILNEYITTDINGIEMLLDNVDIRGIEALKQNVGAFVEEKKKMLEQQQHMAQQQQQIQLKMMQDNNPVMIKREEIQQKQQIDNRKLDIEQQKVDIQSYKTEEELKMDQQKVILEIGHISAQNLRSEVDLARKEMETQHVHTMDVLKFHQDSKKQQTTIEVST
jgi:hypothetical protein